MSLSRFSSGVSNMEHGVALGLDRKQVFDYNHLPLGTISGAALDPKTRDPRALIVDLSPQARQRMKNHSNQVRIPFEMVFGIRRDEVTLSRSLPEMMDIFNAAAPVSIPEQSATSVVPVER